jgi:2-isopropylmalate synthase
VHGTVLDFNVSSVTSGGDALGDVVVVLGAEGSKVSGRGVSTDVVEAAARAYLNAVNRVLRLRENPVVRDVEVGP